MNVAGAGLILLLGCAARAVCAPSGTGPLPYHPETRVAGTIRVWGSAQIAELAERWEKGFVQFHPGVKFENHFYGAVSAIAGLYTGVADLVISREIWPVETLAFQQVRGYKPTGFDVATGSFDVPTKSSSLDIFVHRDNQLSRITLSQLAAIFGAGHNVKNWGDLGLRDAWQNRPIRTYGYTPENAGARLFASLVSGGNPLWACNYKGFENVAAPNGGRVDAGQLILEALALDSMGIAISNVHYANTSVKVIAVAQRDSGPWVLPSRESVRNRTYPLTRPICVFMDRAPRTAPAPKCREFVAYVLSREGQLAISLEGAYLPLPDSLAAVRPRD